MTDIIPAIDIISGKCVRLTRGDYATSKTYYDNPLDIALKFVDYGIKRLHIVDLDGAKASTPANLPVLEKIAARTSLEIEWGGGIKDRDSLDAVLGSGADQAICGSIAVSDPEELEKWISIYGADRIILGADVRNGRVATKGWLEESGKSAEELIGRFIPSGLERVICTDISRDGMLTGPAFSLYGGLIEKFPSIRLTASGGVSSIEDILELDRIGISGVIVGKALYEGRITLENLACLIKK